MFHNVKYIRYVGQDRIVFDTIGLMGTCNSKQIITSNCKIIVLTDSLQIKYLNRLKILKNPNKIRNKKRVV